ncbi:hypothetical protein HRbin01_00409 [archaeon HR01]|nr:hypothetical protein HRbin01_00409 [archaeon HR01]
MKTDEVLPAIRSALAKILVNTLGMKRSDVARVLGVTSQAVSQYVRGRRASSTDYLEKDEKVSALLKDFAKKVAVRGQPIRQTELLDLAYEISTLLRATGVVRTTDEEKRELALRILRGRLQAEHEAAELFMSEAIKSSDDLVRLLFRQIASDSIRHADIIMAVISVVERGISHYVLPDSGRLRQLLTLEEQSHGQDLKKIKELIDNHVVKILIDSVDADEAKHDMILQTLIGLGERS